MAATTTGFPLPISSVTPQAACVPANRRRSISPKAGHALVILGHAIEYLTDEFVHEAGSYSPDNGQLQAVRLLMALNRQIYFECPEVPHFGERLRSLFGFHVN